MLLTFSPRFYYTKQALDRRKGIEASPCAADAAEWSSWQLVGLITRRSKVQILPPQYYPKNLTGTMPVGFFRIQAIGRILKQ